MPQIKVTDGNLVENSSFPLCEPLNYNSEFFEKVNRLAGSVAERSAAELFADQ
jgi:hypothetical protein